MDVDVFDSELGWMAVAGDEGRLTRVLFGYESEWAVRQALEQMGALCSRTRRGQSDLVQQLQDFARGAPQRFDRIALDLAGYTSFACKVVSACRRIPWGQTRTYGDLAALCGAPGAARAVGNVMATNRFPLVVPCHRVVAASGRLGGYSAPQGLAMKRRLLEMEGAVASFRRRFPSAARTLAWRNA